MRTRSPLSLDIADMERKTPKATPRPPHLLLLLRRALALGGAVAGGLPVRVLRRLGARPLLRVRAVLLGRPGHGRLAVFCLFLGHREALAPGPGVRLREEEQDRRRLVLKKKKSRSKGDADEDLKKKKKRSESRAALARPPCPSLALTIQREG